MTFISRMKDFFAYKKDQNASGFIAEMKELTYADKVWFSEEFNKQNMPTDVPAKPLTE